MRARIRTFRDRNEIKELIAELQVEKEAINILESKALHFNILVENLRAPEAIILKESFLSVGGDTAIHREAITGKAERFNVLVFATFRQLKKALPNLKMQPFGLGDLGEEMLKAAKNLYEIPEPLVFPNGNKTSFDRTRIMGILNATPESFSGDGIAGDHERGVEIAVEMESAGADIIDVGGESTRPGAEPIDEKTELSRVVPLIEKLSDSIEIPISIDTIKPSVAEAAIKAGASMVNDISGLADERMISLCAEERVPVIIMHMKGTPETMQDDPRYDDVVGEIMNFLSDRIETAVTNGIKENNIAIDPGIGFGKRLEDNIEILRRISEFKILGRPIMVGTSRKSFIGALTGSPPENRLEGSLASACAAAMNGANIIRTHDVAQTRQALRIADSIRNGLEK